MMRDELHKMLHLKKIIKLSSFTDTTIIGLVEKADAKITLMQPDTVTTTGIATLNVSLK